MIQGPVHNWLDLYFPEFLTVFKDWECKSAIHLLSLYLLPHELVSLSDETLLQHLREVAKSGLGLGNGRDNIAGFLTQVGDIEQYRHPKQIIKLAGLNLKENASGKHKGQAKITKRGGRGYELYSSV